MTYLPLLDATGGTIRIRVRIDGVWELVFQERVVGTVDPLRGRMAGGAGSWSAEQLRHGAAAFRPEGGSAPWVSYYPTWLRAGGTITFSDENWFALRIGGVFSDTRLVDQDGRQLLRFVPVRRRLLQQPTYVNMAIDLLPSEESERYALAATLVACYVVIWYPGGTYSPSGPPAFG